MAVFFYAFKKEPIWTLFDDYDTNSALFIATCSVSALAKEVAVNNNATPNATVTIFFFTVPPPREIIFSRYECYPLILK